jgi:peptide/nickel transport system permease protein
MFCLVVIVLYAIAALLVAAGLLASDHDARVGAKFLDPGPGHWLGTDRQGRDILARTLYSTKIAIMVGLVSAVFSVLVGTLLGSLAGWFKGATDAAIVWLYSTVQSIPSILLLMGLTYVAGRGLFGVYVAFCATFWVGPCRVIRGEVLKLRESEYVQAARSLGYGPLRILFAHVVPNTFHLVLVNFALLFVGAIKAEVILSYLGLGVQGEPSWGVMINQARAELINGFFWQIGAATCAMFLLVLAFNVFADALQDALDPKNL